MKKKILYLTGLIFSLVLNHHAIAQCGDEISLAPDGLIITDGTELGTTVTLADPVGSAVTLADPAPGASPVRINFPNMIAAVITIPNTGGNEIRLPMITGYKIKNSPEGVIITIPADKPAFPVKLNMKVILLVNGIKQTSGSSMAPLPMNGSFPKGGKLVIKFNQTTKQEEIKIIGEQATIKAA